ncbi:MAG: GNAT family N-acetyltransferase [Chloroflexi bacterium]|nr:GNAT family N-acetyltransferase [Chloroflexota bacterium]
MKLTQKTRVINVREITVTEYPLPEDFLYNAFFLPPGAKHPSRKIIFKPEMFVYIKDFGKKDDCGVVAEQDSVAVGAAWTRIITAYGHINNDTPELVISILPEYCREGIGTMLMTHLFKLPHECGYKRMSLSVQKNNPAVQFYNKLGCEIIYKKIGSCG